MLSGTIGYAISALVYSDAFKLPNTITHEEKVAIVEAITESISRYPADWNKLTYSILDVERYRNTRSLQLEGLSHEAAKIFVVVAEGAIKMIKDPDEKLTRLHKIKWKV